MTSAIERLSGVLMGQVLKGIVQVTNSSILTRLDVPVIFRSLGAFAATSRAVRKIVFHKHAIAALVQALCDKYGFQRGEIFSHWGSEKVYSVLKTQCMNNGEKEVYDTTQAIMRVITGVYREARDAGLIESEGCFGPLQEGSRTISGFELELNTHRGSLDVITPYGRLSIPVPCPLITTRVVDLRESDSCDDIAREMLEMRINLRAHHAYREALEDRVRLFTAGEILDRLGAQFERMTPSAEPDTVFEITPTDEPGEMICIRELPLDEVVTRVGTSSMLFCRSQGSRYQLTRAEGAVLPPVRRPEPHLEIQPWSYVSLVWDLFNHTLKYINPPNNLTSKWVLPEVSLVGVRAMLTCEAPLYCCEHFRNFRIFKGSSNFFLDLKRSDIFELLSSDGGTDCQNFYHVIMQPDFFERLASGWKRVRQVDCPNLELHQSEEEYLLFKKCDADSYCRDFLNRMVNLRGIKLSPAMFFVSVASADNKSDLYIWVHKEHAESIFCLLPINLENAVESPSADAKNI